MMVFQNEGLDSSLGQKNVNVGSPAKNVLRNRNFLLLWLGQCTSLIGDQFTMIALPWLVLLVTGDPLALGLVLAFEGVPRAVFMLFGGAVTDRFSQRTVMLISDILRFLLVAMLAAMVLTGSIQMWMLYAISLAFGIVSGFFLPASGSMVPRIVKSEELMVGNSIIQGTAQISVFIGPLLAGGLIALFANSSMALGGNSAAMVGVGAAFAFDALTYLISIVSLWLMKVSVPQASATGMTEILSSIREGINFVIGTPKILYMFLILSAVNFLFVGPFLVGIPTIANSRLIEGAAAFGIIMSAHGLGNLIGLIGSGVIKIKPQNIGLIASGVICVFGIGLAITGFMTSTWVCSGIVFVLGMFNGYLGIVIITMLQKNTPPDMMGRLMSLTIFASTGLVPISQALSGVLIKISLEGLFVTCGVLIFLTGVIAALSKEVKNFGLELQ
ncbi:MFS transporter [Methanooceanicella nereidis]|nr:MFS transporter [Methanocella sp. CWC-04]